MTKTETKTKKTRQSLSSLLPTPKEDISVSLLDAADRLIHAIERIGIMPPGPVAAHQDARGGHVECLTEAVIALTEMHDSVAQGLHSIADAIREHTNAVREQQS
jgi:hypothetical protein